MVILSKGAGAKRALLRRGGTPGETRTHYVPLRRRTLYPGEVRGHTAFGFPNAFLLCHAFRVLSSAFAFRRAMAFISRKTDGFFETGLKIRSFYVKI